MSKLIKLLRALIGTSETFDTVVCGSDYKAEQVLGALHLLGRDFHVIADNKISPSRLYVTSAHALSMFPGGGSN